MAIFDFFIDSSFPSLFSIAFIAKKREPHRLYPVQACPAIVVGGPAVRRHAAHAAPVLPAAHGSAGSHYRRRTPMSVVAVSVKNEDTYLEKGAIFGDQVTATSRPRHLAVMTTIQPKIEHLFLSICPRFSCKLRPPSSPGFDPWVLATRARCPNHCSGTVGRLRGLGQAMPPSYTE